MVVFPFVAIGVAMTFRKADYFSTETAFVGGIMYIVSFLGITVGFHRLFSHRSFRATRALRICLAVAGTFAFQGPVIRWAADHRRHHAFSDRDGDPHSPWRYGKSFWAMVRGMLYAHIGWLFNYEDTNQATFVPDLLGDKDLVIISRYFVQLGLVGAFLPSLVYLMLGGTLVAGAFFFFWTAVLRIFISQHVTWSINSVCHVFGSRPFAARDSSSNVWVLAILSMGESWHNGHHAIPHSAKHGLLRGEVDVSAVVIRGLEMVGLAKAVKWPSESEIEAARVYRRAGAEQGWREDD